MNNELTHKEAYVVEEIKKMALINDINNRFTFHPVQPGQAEKYEEIRGTAKIFALRLAELCPNSRELSVALNHLDQVVFNANSAIAREVK